MDSTYNPTLARTTEYNLLDKLRNNGKGRQAKKDIRLSPEYEDVLARFAVSMRTKSDHTQRLYGTAARHFLGFLKARCGEPDVENITSGSAETYLHFLLEESGYGDGAVRAYVIGARQLCNKLVRDDVLVSQPFTALEGVPTEPMPNRQILRPQDVQAMLDVAKRERTVWGKRDRALMTLLFYGGLRREELLAVHAKDIEWNRATVTIARGKGGGGRTVGLNDTAMIALEGYDTARRKYLSSLRPYRRSAIEKGPIWLSQRGQALSPTGLNALLKVRARQAGIDIPVYPHAWRHAAATHDADAGMGDMEMRDKYGWSPTSAMPFRYSRQTLRERTIQKSRSLRTGDGVRL